MGDNASIACPPTPLDVVCVQPKQESLKKSWLMRPFKVQCLVRTCFEQAAIKHAAEVRRASRFPATATTATTTSIITALTSHTTSRCGNRVVPTQSVKPTVHVAEPSTSTRINSIHWEGDTVVRGIQEMRSQFLQSYTKSFPSNNSQAQHPFRSHPLLPVSPSRDAATRRVRPTCSLLHRSAGRGHGRHQVQDQEDVWVDIEKLSPPRTTYHLYRLSADGTTSALPVTVIPSSTTPLHSKNPTSQGAHCLLVDNEDFSSQNSSSVTTGRQLHSLVVTKAQQDHLSTSPFMEHQTTSFQTSQQLGDSSLVRQPSFSRFHRKPLVFTTPQEQKTSSPAETTENVIGLEDDDVEVISNGEVDLIEISSDSSPEVNRKASQIRGTFDRVSESSRVSSAASQTSLCKASFSAKTNSSKLFTSKDEELPDLTSAHSPIKLLSKDDSKVEDNLSDVSTTIFEDIHFDEWMNEVLETTNMSSSGGTEVVPSNSLVDTVSSPNQTERNVTMVNDNNKIVALFCAEQCSILTTGGKHRDTVKHNVTNRPPDTEDKSKEWPTGHNDTNPHLDVRNDQDTHLISDKSAIGDNEAKEAAPVYRAYDEETKLIKEDNKEKIADGVSEAEPVHHAHGENIKVIENDNIKHISNDQLETKLEDEITLEKYYVADMEKEAAGKVPLEATRSEITKKDTTSQEENKLPAIAIGLSGTNSISITNTSEHACVDSASSNCITAAVVGEVRNSPSWNTTEENADTARNFLENDKKLKESTSFVCGSEKRIKQMVKTRMKKRKRSMKLKKAKRLQTIWRRHDDDDDCLQVVDPSCTLFVSDGQVIVAMQVPTSTPKENVNATENRVKIERAPQQSIHSPSSSNSVHFHISSPLQLPAAIAVSPKGISSTCEMNEHQTTKSETGDVPLDKSNHESKEQANMKQDANEVHAGSGKVTQTSEEHGEETNEDEMEDTINRENELNRTSKSLIEKLKRCKQNEIYETDCIQNSETEPKDASCISLICTNKMLTETREDTEKVNSGMFIRDETLSEANRSCENSTAAKSITDTELNQQLNEAHKENLDAREVTEEKLNIQENIRLAALLQETVERKTLPNPVSQTVEERTNLEKTSEKEKIVAPEVMHGEEKAIAPEQGSEVKNEIGTFERVREDNDRNPSEYVSVVEDELTFGRKKIQGTEKDPVDSVVLSQCMYDDCTREEIRLEVGRNSNRSSTSISHLTECFMSLRLKEPLTCQLTQLHTEPTVSASSNIKSSVGHGESQTLSFSSVVPLDSVSPCRRRYMDALKDLVEELRLMGERNINSMSREGGDSLNTLPFDPELFHIDNQKASIKRSEKEETKGLTSIQCIAEIHSCADVESNEDDKQFKLPQLIMENEILGNDSKREEKRRLEITAETEAANVVLSSRNEELYVYNTQREARYMNIEIKKALNRSLKDIPHSGHNGKTPEPMIDGMETGKREISVHLSSNSIKKSCADLGIECKGSTSSKEVENSIDLKHYDVTTVMKTNEEKHMNQGSTAYSTTGEEDLAAVPSQGINVKVMKSISVDSVSDPCPSLSVSNFTKKEAMKINQLCAESNNSRFHQDGRRRPGEFNHIFEDFMETVHCKKKVQEKQVGTVLPLGNNIMQSLDSEQHKANGKVEGSYFSSRGNDPLLLMNCTQPLDCGMHSEVYVTRGEKSGAQSLESENQPAISETQLSANSIQLALCETGSVACDIQPAVSGTQPVVDGTQPVVGEIQPAVCGAQLVVSEAQPEVCRINPAVCSTQPVVGGTQPTVGRTQSATGGVQPAVGGIQPAVDEVQPAINGVQPGAGGTQPVVCGTQSAVDEVQPAINGVQPGAGGTQPVVCGTQSAVGGTQTAVCGIQSVVGEIQPTVDGTQPTLSATQPAVGEIPSTIAGTQSAVCGTWPAVVRTFPAIDETQAAVCGTRPAIGESQIAVYVTQPAVGGIQAGVGGTQPAFCETQSAVGGIQPGDGIQPAVCGTQPETCDAQLAVCEIQSDVCKTKLVCGTQPWFQGAQSTRLPASMALPTVVNVIQSSVGLDQPLVSETHPSPKDIQSSVDQTATNQTHSSSSWTLQSSEVNQSTASGAQPSDFNYGRDVTRERERRYREESADEESEVEGSHGRKRRKKARVTTRHHIVEVSLTEKYKESLRMVAMAGEAFLSPLRSQSVMGSTHGFASLRPDHTRSLLNQMVRTIRGRCQSSSEEKNSYYKNLLALHGLIKAADFLLHYGFEPALHCLDQFHHTHHVFLGGCYTDVVARLAAVQERGGEGVVHPKVTTLRREMEQARQREDPGDTEFKVLVVVKREAQWVYHQLQEEFGSDNVAVLSRLPEYDRVLYLLEQKSVVVWEEGEALHQLPCSQFNLVVEWEGSSGSSICVDHCTRQNIHVVSFITPSPSVDDKEPVTRNEDGDQQEGKVIINLSRNESLGEIMSYRSCVQRDPVTIVASTSVTANNELHYILTSIFNINLVERNPRDVIIEEGRQGWPDLLLDERTCVLLRPLATLRSDAHLNELTCQLVLLSLQCTTCYIILYAQQSNSSGYEFRSSVMRALTRLVATCVLFRSSEYTVSLLLAYSLHQVGELVRNLCEATRASSPVWNPEEWNTRPWLTSQMSSHERLLLSLPCINSISAQVILTAMKLLQVLESSFPQLRNTLPWIPNKVIMMLFKFIHGVPVTDIKVGRHYCGSCKVLLDHKDKNIQHKPKMVEGEDQSEIKDPDFLNHSIFNPEKGYMNKTACTHLVDEIVHCCDKEERQVPPFPCDTLPDKVSLPFPCDTLPDKVSFCDTLPEKVSLFSKVNWEGPSSAVVSADPYVDINKIPVVPSKMQIQNCSTTLTETLTSAVSTNRYSSSYPNESCASISGSSDLYTVLGADLKNPPKDLFSPYKYLNFMEHDKRTDAQLPQQYQPDQYQQPPPQYMQPLQQYHQIPQSQQSWHPSPQFLQKQECHESRRDGHIHIVSPYFPTFHDSQINSRQSETLPQQCYHQKQPHPLTTQFQPQIKSEALRPVTLLHPNNSKSYPVHMPNTQQYQQGCLQQLCSNETFETVAPHQWHDVINESVSPQLSVQQSEIDYDFSNTCNYSTNQAKSIRPWNRSSEDKRLLYQKVPGWGSQTKLVFNTD